MNPKQIKFCELYHQTGNATQSYIDAGYKVKNEEVASVMSSRLLGNDKIREYLATLQKAASAKNNVTVERIMDEAAKIAFADLNEIVAIEEGILVLKKSQDLNQLEGVSASRTVSESSTDKGSSSSVSNSFSVKRADRLKALDMLARMIGAYDRRENDNSRILQDNAPRVLDALKRYRNRAKTFNHDTGEEETA